MGSSWLLPSVPYTALRVTYRSCCPANKDSTLVSLCSHSLLGTCAAWSSSLLFPDGFHWSYLFYTCQRIVSSKWIISLALELASSSSFSHHMCFAPWIVHAIDYKCEGRDCALCGILYMCRLYPASSGQAKLIWTTKWIFEVLPMNLELRSISEATNIWVKVGSYLAFRRKHRFAAAAAGWWSRYMPLEVRCHLHHCRPSCLSHHPFHPVHRFYVQPHSRQLSPLFTDLRSFSFHDKEPLSPNSSGFFPFVGLFSST